MVELARRDTTDARAAEAVVQFWLRAGLLREAEFVCRDLTHLAPSVRTRVAEISWMQLQRLERDRTPLGRARLELATSRWSGAGRPLLAVLVAARRAGTGQRADRVARLLLARNSNSREALAHLVSRTHDPALALVHLHYGVRLLRLVPESSEVRALVQSARIRLRGTEESNH